MKGDWSGELLTLMGVPRRILPEIRPSSGDFGTARGELLGSEVPICGVAGDQQAALHGQGCWEAGTGKCTYGTGAFLLFNTGADRVDSRHGLLTTAACDAAGGPAFALEGSIFIAGAAIQWLRDGLGLLEGAAESEEMARGLTDNAGVYLVPAFAGLGAPLVAARRAWHHHRTDPRHHRRAPCPGGTGGHGLRNPRPPRLHASATRIFAQTVLKVDGGAARNDWLMEFLSGILGIEVSRPAMVETTALGAAGLAGLHAGVWRSPEDFSAAFARDSTFRLGDERRKGAAKN